MGQHIIIAVLFLMALAYLGYMVFRNFNSKSCASGCGSCGIDFDKIRKNARLDKGLARRSQE